jgi:predicted N-formylglutamate amidohydrolase
MDAETVFDIINPDGQFPLVLSCEHASYAVPAEYSNLGLSEHELRRHIGWDIGARAVLEIVAQTLDAPAVCSGYSRLLIDCNRDLQDDDLIIKESDGTVIPGNAHVSSAERQKRLSQLYYPYHAAIDRMIEQMVTQKGADSVRLLSLHSFTAAMRGQDRPQEKLQERSFDIGILFDRYADLATDLGQRLQSEGGYRVRHNEPYSGYDGLIFSARSHGDRHRLVYLELEMNNSLLTRPDEIDKIGKTISQVCMALFSDENR